MTDDETPLAKLRELVWPRLIPLSPDRRQEEQDSLTADHATINTLPIGTDTAVALEEARRLADAEADRRKGADQKASTYLAVVAGLIPLILTLAGASWEGKAGGAPTWLNMIVLGLAVAYLSAAGLWAFRVLKVAGAHRIGIGNLETAWSSGTPTADLVRQVLWCARCNFDPVNKKISSIKIAHEFLLRAFFTFAALLLFNIGWYLVSTSWPAGNGDPWMRSGRNALAANAALDRLEAELGIQDAWSLLVERCRTPANGRAGALQLRMLANHSVAPPPELQPMLRVTGQERLRFRRIALSCGPRALGRIDIWDRPPLSGAGSLGPPFDRPGTRHAPFRVLRDWPPASAGPADEVLPQVLIRQLALFGTAEQGGMAYVEASLGSGVLGDPPAER